jgi:hypothetical protein
MVGGLCKYRDALGVPGRGAHSWRRGGVAVVDVILTVLSAGLLAWALDANFWIVLVGLFVAGIGLHRMFCVRTTVDQLLFSA